MNGKARKLTVVPLEKERKALREVARLLETGKPGRAQLVSPDGHRTIIPDVVYEVLRQAVRELDRGQAISLLPVTAQLTTQQAADFLGVSRPFLVSVLERGELSFYRVGTHRRVYLSDLEAYRRQRDETSDAALRDLVSDAQDLGIYDE